MITYETIEAANNKIRTTDIKGKDYAEVNQRIKAFRMCFPEGRIETELLKLEDGICVMKAKVYTDNGSLLGTGTAYEKEGSSFINKTSYIENCETSAVGRALGMCGFGIDTSIASYEEVCNAKIQNEGEKLASEVKKRVIKEACEKHKINLDAWLLTLNLDWNSLNEDDATKMIASINRKYNGK